MSKHLFTGIREFLEETCVKSSPFNSKKVWWSVVINSPSGVHLKIRFSYILVTLSWQLKFFVFNLSVLCILHVGY